MNLISKNSIYFILVMFILVCSNNSFSQNKFESYQKIVKQIHDEGMKNGKAFEMLKQLTKHAGSRLAGSPGAAAAVELTRNMMDELGLDVHLEPVMVPHWRRGIEEARIVNSSIVGTQSLTVCALGGSVGTPETGITASVIEVQSFEELQRLGGAANGKIVFFNRPMDPTEINTFAAYGGAVNQRTDGAVEGAKVGAVAVLVRSVTTRVDDIPHTGMMQYENNIPKIPAAALSLKGANLLSDLLKSEKEVVVNLRLSCENLKPAPSANVIGQITGTENPEEIILLGGHLDSWDLGVGAHDDGAGCVHAIEAVRLIKTLGLKPNRSIRAVMFMNEEFGGSGGRSYANANQREGEKHLAAIESDRGGFMPVGFGVGGDEATFKKVESWLPFFKSTKLQWLQQGGGGVDIGPLAAHGTVLMGLVVEDQRYFDVHHSANDVLEAVNERELELGAIAMAIMAYLLAQEGI